MMLLNLFTLLVCLVARALGGKREKKGKMNFSFYLFGWGGKKIVILFSHFLIFLFNPINNFPRNFTSTNNSICQKQ